MKFLDDIQIYRNDFGIQLVIKMNYSWRKAAEKFPRERGKDIFRPQIELANSFLKELEQKTELEWGRFGLHHIHLIPGSAGLDLQDSQNSYIGHNLTSPLQIAALTPVILRYLRDLELFEE